MTAPLGFEPRAICTRCRRPESVCYCRHLTSLATHTRVVLLQHPRERDKAIGTAYMASLCLPNAELHVGVRFGDSLPLRRALSDPACPAALLYPGEGAIDVMEHPPEGPITLVVVDGTWWQAKKVIRENPMLAALPRYAFTPANPSEYRIRKEPHPSCVSTIEAIMHVLGALEGEPERFRALLAPFRAMIDSQIDCEQRHHGGRVRHVRAKAERAVRRRVPTVLDERRDDLVCVVGEANAWPYREPPSAGTPGFVRASYPDELVQWVAHRVSTAETFAMVVAPRHPVAPRTPDHIGLSHDALIGGRTLSEMLAGWREFVRDTDVICSWGHYAPSLFADSGGYLPTARVDLRNVARVHAARKVGTLEEYSDTLDAPHEASLAEGRAGVRLAAIARIARYFSAKTAP